MKYLIVTGMSGAGKTSAIHALEDLGYYCVDNLPPSLIPQFIELWQSNPGTEECAAFGVDIRSRQYFGQFKQIMNDIRAQVEVLFMDCRNEELLKRYKTTRRIHPLQGPDQKVARIEDALTMERSYLAPMREQADYVLDTSESNVWQSRDAVQTMFGGDNKPKMRVLVNSFGFSKGIPVDCDLVFDVRFLPNPHYVDELREHTGKEKIIQDYVMKDGSGEQFLNQLIGMLEFLVPLYEKEGKSQLIIGIGCTGGKHRSVTIATLLTDLLNEKGMRASCYHRDVVKA